MGVADHRESLSNIEYHKLYLIGGNAGWTSTSAA
jgi:hypothetical protein